MTGRRALAVEAALAGMIALAVAAPLVAYGPPGVDLAAHVYQVGGLAGGATHGGWALWDDYWYSGTYRLVTYSVLWSPLAGVVGIATLGLASIVAGAVAAAAVLGRTWGRAARASAFVFAASWGAMVETGAYPFLLGAALALGALWALSRWRSGRGGGGGGGGGGWRTWRSWPAGAFGLLALTSLAASPLAFLALALVVAAAALSEGRRGVVALRRALAVLVGLGLVEVLVARAFPDYGRYPFWVGDLAWIIGFCAVVSALTWGVARARALVAMAGLYAAVSVVAFVVPSPVGANLARLQYAATAVMVLVVGLRAWRPRWACVGAVAAAGAWNLIPLAGVVVGGGTAVGEPPAYWQPVVSYLHAHLAPSYRVEAVDTAGHWAADRLAGAGIPLVRGWYRQDDFPADAILYRSGPLDPGAYRRWLRSLGVAYVVRTDGPPDFSSSAEAALLASGRSGLAVAQRSAHAVVYAVPHPTAIVTGPAPARLVSVAASSLVVAVGGPGTYRLAVHWTPYWRASSGCLAPSPDGMTTLVAHRSGQVTVSFEVDPSVVAATVLGRPGRAPPAGPPPGRAPPAGPPPGRAPSDCGVG